MTLSDQLQVQHVKVCCRSWDLTRSNDLLRPLDGAAEFITYTLTPEQAERRKAVNDKKAERIARSRVESRLEEFKRQWDLLSEAAVRFFADGQMPRWDAVEKLQQKRRDIDIEYMKVTQGEGSLLDKRANGSWKNDDLGLPEQLQKKKMISREYYEIMKKDEPKGGIFPYLKKKIYPRKIVRRKPVDFTEYDGEKDSDAPNNGMAKILSDPTSDSRMAIVNAQDTPPFFEDPEKNILSILSKIGITKTDAVTTLCVLGDGSQEIATVYDGGQWATSSASCRIIAHGPFDTFLARLRLSRVQLNKAGVKVLEDDDLYNFFHKTLQASEVNFTVELPPNDAKSAIFKGISVKLALPVAIEYSSNDLLASTKHNFNMTDYPIFKMPDPAYFFGDSSILMGLTPESTKLPWTLEKVLVALDLLPQDAANILQTLRESMDAQGGQFTLAAGALWFTPGPSYIVRNRLEWHLSDADVASVQKFVHHFLPKLNITECKIIGRKMTQRYESMEIVNLLTTRKVSLVLGAKYSDAVSFSAIIDVVSGGEGGSMNLILSPPAVTIKDIIVWIISIFDPNSSNMSDKHSSSMLDFINAIPIIGTVADHVILRRAEINLSGSNLNRLTLSFEINPGWKDKSNNDIPFLVCVTSISS